MSWARGAASRSQNRDRELAATLQFDPPARIAWLQTTCTGRVHARIRRVAGFAPSTGFAGHAGATASSKLTFDLDHSMWAAQLYTAQPEPPQAVARLREILIEELPLH